MGNILRVKNLTVSYGSTVVVENASFEVNEGEIVAIVGGNSSGKSSIFNSITRWTDGGKRPPNASGEVFFLENDILKFKSDQQWREFKRSIGYAAQSDKPETFEPNVTSKMVLERSLSESHGGKKDRINDALLTKNILQKFGLWDEFAKKRCRNLSGGRMRIITVLSALVRNNARLYLIDEPVNNLDTDMAKRLSNYLIEEIRNKDSKAGVLLITHCRMFPKIDRAYELDSGKLSVLDDYTCKNCFGETDNSGLYAVKPLANSTI